MSPIEVQPITCGIFYCRDITEIKVCGSLQTSLRFDSDELRNRQQKHTAVRRYAALWRAIPKTWMLQKLIIKSVKEQT